MKDFLKRNLWNIILIILLGLFTYVALIKRAPINMDEFSQYHPIICNHFASNKLNIFREKCGMYDLVLPGTNAVLPLRAYPYGGSLAALYYYPIYLLWSSPDSARMMGFLFILLQAWVLGKILKQRFAYTLIGLVAFFPYYYQVIVDTGIVQFYTTAVLFICYFIGRWFPTHKWRYIVGIGALLFLLIYARLSFVFGIPALVLIFLATAWQNKLNILLHFPKLLKQALVALVVLGVPLLLFFYTTAPGNSTVHPILKESGRTLHTLSEMLRPETYQNSPLLPKFLDPLQATERNYAVPSVVSPISIIYTVLLFGIPPLILLVQWIQEWRHKGNIDNKLFLYIIAFVITVLFLFASKETQHMHHVMMAYPFLVLAWGCVIPYLTRRFGMAAKIFLVVLILLNGYFYLTFTNGKFYDCSDPSIIKMNSVLNNDYLARNYFYVATDWGTYYYQGLYGPDQQSVLYIGGSESNKAVLDKLSRYPAEYDRQILFMYDKRVSRTKAALLKFDPSLVECSLTKDSPVWGILIPKNMTADNPCR
jgi:hypothetical protein